jgi:hypothetical protein
MRKEEIDTELSKLAFEFFYWFSRFEFALKESGYLESHDLGHKAEPGWRDFTQQWSESYVVSAQAASLLASPPDRQIVAANSSLDWKPVGLEDCKSDLERTVRLLKTVRNNLFHGGKHGAAGWDHPDRTRELLAQSKLVLDQLAQLSSMEDHYTRYY